MLDNIGYVLRLMTGRVIRIDNHPTQTSTFIVKACVGPSMLEFTASEIGEGRNARLIKALVTPRPIAWISTVDSEGVENLAPFSCYNFISSRRPVVHFSSAGQSEDGLTDTARNVIEIGEFAVNIVTPDLLEAMDTTSAPVDTRSNEFDVVGIESTPCRRIQPPRVRDAVATMECTLHDTIEVYDRLLVLGDVIHYHLDEAVMRDDQVDAQLLETVGRLGGPYYTISEPVEFERHY